MTRMTPEQVRQMVAELTPEDFEEFSHRANRDSLLTLLLAILIFGTGVVLGLWLGVALAS